MSMHVGWLAMLLWLSKMLLVLGQTRVLGEQLGFYSFVDRFPPLFCNEFVLWFLLFLVFVLLFVFVFFNYYCKSCILFKISVIKTIEIQHTKLLKERKYVNRQAEITKKLRTSNEREHIDKIVSKGQLKISHRAFEFD